MVVHPGSRQRNPACAPPAAARRLPASAPCRTGSLSGRPRTETWGRPASEFPSRETCPPGTPAHRAHLAAAGSRPASPPRSVPRPWPRATAPQPAAAGALPGTSAARPGHTPRLPPPAARRGQSCAGGRKLKALRSQSGVTGSSPHPPSSSGSLPT